MLFKTASTLHQKIFSCVKVASKELLVRQRCIKRTSRASKLHQKNFSCISVALKNFLAILFLYKHYAHINIFKHNLISLQKANTSFNSCYNSLALPIVKMFCNLI